MNIPEGCYRHRVCGTCRENLEATGYLTHEEAMTQRRGTCDICGRSAITEIIRYTLSLRARKKRGLP